MNISMPIDSELSADKLLELIQENFSSLLWLVLNDEILLDQIVDPSEFNKVPKGYNINNEEVQNRLGQIFNLNMTKWLIPNVEIEKELDNIKSHQNISVCHEVALQCINLYIHSKILYRVMSWFCPDEYDKESTNSATAGLKRMFRRKTIDGALSNPQSELDTHLSNAVQVLATRAPKEFDYKRFLISFTSGDTDRYFLTQIFDCFQAPNMEPRDLYYVLAPLFKLICQDKNIMSETEYDNYSYLNKPKTRKKIDGEIKIPYYTYSSYRTYLASIFRSIDSRQVDKRALS